MWQAQKEQEMGEDSMVVALWHRKTNVGPLLKPVTLKITFSPSFSVERVATGEYKTWPQSCRWRSGWRPHSEMAR